MLKGTNENTGTVRRYFFNVTVSRYYPTLTKALGSGRYTVVEAYAVEETSRQIAECVVRSNAMADGGMPKILKITHTGSVPV